MKPTLAVVREALGYLPHIAPGSVPPVTFDLGPQLLELGCQEVTRDCRLQVTEQLAASFEWCARRFPLLHPTSDGRIQVTVQRFEVGHSIRPEEILSASSAQALGKIFIAANWPLSNIYRLGSLVAHESMHQALYLRELSEPVVRNHSLAYSPWKNSLRPGRLIWHSFWTFVCQFTMLGEAVASDTDTLRHDPSLLSFLADMQARILLCSESATALSIFLPDEAKRHYSALQIVEEIAGQLRQFPGYQQSLEAAQSSAFDAYYMWSSKLLAEAPS